jgi:hypothetical protein
MDNQGERLTGRLEVRAGFIKLPLAPDSDDFILGLDGRDRHVILSLSIHTV